MGDWNCPYGSTHIMVVSGGETRWDDKTCCPVCCC